VLLATGANNSVGPAHTWACSEYERYETKAGVRTSLLERLYSQLRAQLRAQTKGAVEEDERHPYLNLIPDVLSTRPPTMEE